MCAELYALPERIRSRIAVQDDGCWIWTGGRVSKGYGSVYWQGRVAVTHRVVYELLVGDIPSGAQLHHRCEVKACVNPDHLEPLDPAEHSAQHELRGGAARNALKVSCSKGHPFDDANTRWLPDGSRVCRACDRERRRAERQTPPEKHRIAR